MRHHIRFSPALFIACLALTVALGGVSYAAVALPKNSVGSKQVKDHSLRKRDFASNSLKPNTIRGVFAAGGEANGSGDLFTESLSFAFTLALPPAANRIGVGEPVTAACPAANPPEAALGNFCLYESARSNLDFIGFVDPASNMSGAGRLGVAPQYESDGSGDVSVRGSWAVNAP